MNRDFYFFARVFLGLAAFCGILQSIIFFFLGRELFTVQVFPTWLLVAGAVNAISMGFVLRYHYCQGYLFAFATGMFLAGATLFHAVVAFMIRVLSAYYIPAAYFLVGSGMLYGLVLLFSNTRKKPWLKFAGISIIVVCVGNVIAFALLRTSPEMAGASTVLSILKWTSLGGAGVPILFIINFLSEEKLLNVDEVKGPSSKFAEGLLAISLISAFVLSTVLGYQLATQSASKGRASITATKMSQQFEARTFVSSNGNSMAYRLLAPMDYDSSKAYPLAVCLHGGAGWGTDNIKQFDGSLEAQILASTENRKKYPAFIFVPQCPPGASWGGIPQLRDVDSLVFDIIDSLEREFSIDTHRRYVMGHSLGGFGTWYFIGTRPYMFAAAVPSAGFGDPKFAEAIVDVPVWAFHGRLDRNVPVSGSRDIIEAIKLKGGNPRYTEYPHIAHGTSDVMKGNSELLDWIFAQRRE